MHWTFSSVGSDLLSYIGFWAILWGALQCVLVFFLSLSLNLVRNINFPCRSLSWHYIVVMNIPLRKKTSGTKASKEKKKTWSLNNRIQPQPSFGWDKVSGKITMTCLVLLRIKNKFLIFFWWTTSVLVWLGGATVSFPTQPAHRKVLTLRLKFRMSNFASYLMVRSILRFVIIVWVHISHTPIHVPTFILTVILLYRLWQRSL